MTHLYHASFVSIDCVYLEYILFWSKCEVVGHQRGMWQRVGFGLTVSSNYWQCYIHSAWPAWLSKPDVVGYTHCCLERQVRCVIPMVSSCVSPARTTHLAVPLYSGQAGGWSARKWRREGSRSAGTGLPGASAGRWGCALAGGHSRRS